MIDLTKAKEIREEFTQYNARPEDLFRQLSHDGLRLSQHLEALDPSEMDELGRRTDELDAFERHLAVCDLQLSGPNQARVVDLANAARYIMPELFLREIKAGMEVHERYLYGDCVAVKTVSKTRTYHPLYIPELNNATAGGVVHKSLGERAAGARGGEFPVVVIRQREKDIVLADAGREIQVAYNVIRDYPWEDFAVFLRLIGAQIAVDKLYDIYDLGITGDGTVGAAVNTFNGVAATLAYTDLLRNALAFGAPFAMDRILAPQQSMETVLALPQFSDPNSWNGQEFQKSGKPVTPMGAKLKQIDPTPRAVPVGTVIVTLDSKFAVRETVSQELDVEADKIINLKFDQAVVSEESKFSVIADGALRRIVWT